MTRKYVRRTAFPMVNRFWKWVLGIVNRRLKDYTVRVGQICFRPIGLSLDLDNLVLIQNENPDPPVANIKRLHARVHWNNSVRSASVGQKTQNDVRLVPRCNQQSCFNHTEQLRMEKGKFHRLGDDSNESRSYCESL